MIVKKEGVRLKKSICFIVCILLTAAVFSGCGDTMKEYDIRNIDSRCIRGSTEFAFNIFRELLSEDRGENVFISPVSISTAFAMTYNGARLDTEREMADVLGFSGLNRQTVNESFKNLNGHLRSIKDVELNIANSIWIREGENINETFLSRMEEYFDAKTDTLDFSQEGAADTINGWISDKTKSKIKRMLNPPIPSDVVMYLINAIYFKGSWKVEFDPEKTYDADFSCISGQKQQVKMMLRKGSIEYLDTEGYKAVRIPYRGNSIAMYCILPDEGTDINQFAENINAGMWEDIRDGVEETEKTILGIPKFKVEYGIKKLNDSLEKLGMETAFTPGADFSDIRGGISISRVLHKAVIEVNEKGSEAAGATVVEMVESAMLNPPSFIADRPFIYIIADDDTGSILFMGMMAELKQE